MSNQYDQPTHEMLAAYALGALDADEVLQVEAYLKASQEGRTELQEYRDVVAMLPQAAQPVEPPDHVRRQLLARIDASRPDASQAPARDLKAAMPPQARRRWSFVMPAFAALLLALLVGLGSTMLSLQGQVAQLAQANQTLTDSLAQTQADLVTARTDLTETQNDLATSQADLTQTYNDLVTAQTTFQDRVQAIEDQLSQEQQAFTFVTAPGVATRQLIATDTDSPASGEMYMRSGQNDAVILFHGLTPPPEGEVYVFWLGQGEQQVPAGMVTVDNDGLARLYINAPREVNAFEQVMVTIEESPEITVPSEQVLLEGLL